MSQRQKLIDRIIGNPNGVRFDDACKVAAWLGFEGGSGSGSHRAYSRRGEPEGLNFQNRQGFIPPYQARQLIRMIDRYKDEL